MSARWPCSWCGVETLWEDVPYSRQAVVGKLKDGTLRFLSWCSAKCVDAALGKGER